MIIVLFIALIGLIVGSFLNVVILRLHEGKQFTKGRSACPHCKHQLGVLELIPVVSWIVLRGKCKNCGKPISIQYPLVELATAALFVALYLSHIPATYGNLIVLLLWAYITASLIVLAVYDLRWYLLPDKVMLPIIIPAAAILVSQFALTGHYKTALYPLGAALIFGGGFYALAAVSKGRWMGGGDIKLAFVMGLLLGLQKTALAMLIAFWGAALIGILLIVAGRRKRSDHIPFGPFLIAGTLAAYFYGANIIHWYLSMSGFTS